MYLKAAVILYRDSIAEKIWKEEKESKQYSYECYDAFISADEVSGRKYTEKMEKDIEKFFLFNLKYMEHIEELTKKIKKDL